MTRRTLEPTFTSGAGPYRAGDGEANTSGLRVACIHTASLAAEAGYAGSCRVIVGIEVGVLGHK
jgi:hypothetical protein